MNRIATSQLYSPALLGIQTAQSKQADAEAQVSSGYVASDLKGYASQASALIATRTVSSRLDAYAQNATALSSKLSTQDQALTSVSSAVTNARQSILNAISVGDGSTLVTQLQSAFSSASQALNTQYDGQYLFSGGSDSAPSSTSDFTALASAATPLSNGSLKSVSRIDDNVTVTTGVLATDVAGSFVSTMQSISSYVQANGAFSNPLTTAQTTFLQSVLQPLQTASDTATQAAAQNGVVQQQVSNAQTSLTARQTTATDVLSGITDADPAKAATALQLAQAALQASAQVFASLKSSSLLSVLSSS